MPSPSPDMVNILSHLRFRELVADLTGLTNTNFLSSQAADMFKAEATTHTEYHLLTLMLVMVNQNVILQKQIEKLKDEFEEFTTKNVNKANQPRTASKRSKNA
ncbi:uncharacterized protein LAJ45_06865 [Morchella importuna]|uniref:uncharacterized protein n=1 Tax=Morchella importuna TaxID=1174673 RepID=UPI001E8DAEE3|nr:uncharacterized protein LAJ45_06865 [Morchella importuna]KAH8148891.1 hypothetical protein LAJ45_06865 [Morchella importuna]